MFKSVQQYRLLFHSIYRRSSFRWISCLELDIQMKKHNDQNQFGKCLSLFTEYEKTNDNPNPSSKSLTQALKACQRTKNFQFGREILQKYSSTLDGNDSFLLTSMIHFYIQLGDVNNAQRIFDSSPTKSMGMFGAMVKGLVKNNLSQKAIDLFLQIPNPNEMLIVFFLQACSQLGTESSFNLATNYFSKLNETDQRNEFILCTLANLYLQMNQLDQAECILGKMSKSDIKYRMLMKICNLRNEPEKTFEIFQRMKKDRFPSNEITSLLLINAAAQIGIQLVSQRTIQIIPKDLLNKLPIQNALIHMWGRSGLITECQRIFEQIRRPDIISLTSMIHSYGLNGMGLDAVQLYSRIPFELTNERTHICVLYACSHSGLVDQAKQIFEKISNRTEFVTTAMVDCLSRSFLFDEARSIIQKYELNHSASLPMYMSLLSSARNQRNTSLSEEIFHRIGQIFPNYKQELIPAAVLLANAYQSSGDRDKASDVKNQLTQRGSKKQQGLSWTLFDGRIFKFGAHDRSHRQSKQIYVVLGRMRNEVIQHGYQFDASSNTRILLNDENLESVLCGHSEKLALALHFIQRRKPKFIQITTNLRICQDCHQWTKMICRIRQCSVIIRDANRIHHFDSNGRCSCQDHF